MTQDAGEPQDDHQADMRPGARTVITTEQHAALKGNMQHADDSEGTEDDETQNEWPSQDGYTQNGGPSKKQKVGISAAARQQKSSNDHGGCRNHTGYIGVRKRNWGMYAAEIRDGAKRRWLGSFSQAKEAGQAYDAALILQKKHRAKTNFSYSDFATIPRPGAEPGGKVRYALIPKDIMELYKDQYREVLEIINNGGGLGLPPSGGNNGSDSGDGNDDDHQSDVPQRVNVKPQPQRAVAPPTTRAAANVVANGGGVRTYSPAGKVGVAVGSMAANAMTAAASALNDMSQGPAVFPGSEAMVAVAPGRAGRSGGGHNTMAAGYVPEGMMMMMPGGPVRPGRSTGGGRKPHVMGYDLSNVDEQGNGVDMMFVQGMAGMTNMAFMPNYHAMPMGAGGEDMSGHGDDDDDDAGAPGFNVMTPYPMAGTYPMVSMGPAAMMVPGGMPTMMPGGMHPGMHPSMGMYQAYATTPAGYNQLAYQGGQGSEEGESDDEEEGGPPAGMPGPQLYMMNPAATGMMGWNGGPMMAGGAAGWGMPPQRMQGRERSAAGAAGGKGNVAAGQHGMMRAGGQGMGPSPPGARAQGKGTPVSNGAVARGTPGRTGSPSDRVAAGGGSNAQNLGKRGSSDSEQHTHIPPNQNAMVVMQQQQHGGRGAAGTSGRGAPVTMQTTDAVQEHMFDYPVTDMPVGMGDVMTMGRMYGSGGGARMMGGFAAGYGHEGVMDPQAMYGAYPAGAYMMTNNKQMWSPDMSDAPRRTPGKGQMPPQSGRHKMASPQ